MYSVSQRQQILEIARTTIEASVRNGTRTLHTIKTNDEDLLQPRGNFVTITINHHLRGCIGSVEETGELLQSVAEHAYSAAFKDPRFTPVTTDELKNLSISVSILTPKEVLEFTTEGNLLQSLRPGIDGLLIQKGPYQATFLPTVWDSLPTPDQFLQQLKLKAGISLSDKPDRAWRYTAITLSE